MIIRRINFCSPVRGQLAPSKHVTSCNFQALTMMTTMMTRSRCSIAMCLFHEGASASRSISSTGRKSHSAQSNTDVYPAEADVSKCAQEWMWLTTFLRSAVIKQRIGNGCLIEKHCLQDLQFLEVIFSRCHYLYSVASNGRTVLERQLGKDLEGTDRGLVEILFRYLPGGYEESHEENQSGKLMC
jgi:hypothetical protein